jgi:hypothetical protein
MIERKKGKHRHVKKDIAERSSEIKDGGKKKYLYKTLRRKQKY